MPKPWKEGDSPQGDYDRVRRNPLILGVAMFLINIGFKMFQPFIPLYLRSLNASIPDIGLVFAGIALATYAAALPGGVLADRFGRRKIIVYGNAVCFGILLALLAVASWQSALLVIFVFVFASYLVQPVYAASLAESSRASDRGGAFGTFFTLGFLGIAVGTLIGGYLPNPGHFQLNIVLAALVGLAATGVQAVLVKETGSRDVDRPRSRLLSLARLPRSTWLVLLSTLIYYCASGVWSTLYAVFATEQLGFSTMTFAVMVAGSYVAAAAGALFARHLSKRVGVRTMTMLSIAASWPVILPWIYLRALSVTLLAAMYFLFAINNVGLQILIVGSAPPEKRGTIVGLVTTIAGFGSVGAPYVGSLLWVSFSPSFPLAVAAVVGTASALPLLLLPKQAVN